MNVVEHIETAKGLAGFKEISDGQTVTGNFFAILAKTDTATFSALSNLKDNLSQGVFVQGVTIYGSFNSVSVVTGTVLAYYADV